MSEEHFMTGLLIVLFSGIFIFICIQRLKNFFPVSAFKSFESVSEIKSYYKSSVTIISKKRWLLLLPLFITLAAYLLKIPIFLYQRPEISALSDPGLNKFTNDFFSRISLFDIIKTLFQTPNLLDYGYHGSISGSIIFLGFFLICCITFKAESKKLQSHSVEYNYKNVAFFEKILKYSLIFLIAILSLTATIYLTRERNNQLLFFIIYGPAVILIGITSLSLFSLIEGFILFSVRNAILKEEHNFNMLLNNSLSILKPLFLINIIFAVIGYIPSAALFPITLSSYFDVRLGQSATRTILLNLSSLFTYINAIVAAFAFCTPFFMIFHNVKALEAFKLTFNFIRNNLLKYLIFVGIGILILFLPSLLHSVLRTYIHPLKFESIIIEIFVVALRLSLSVIFYIAMFGFLFDTYFKHSLSKDAT